MDSPKWNINRLTMSGLMLVGLLALGSTVPYYFSWSKLNRNIQATQTDIEQAQQSTQELLNIERRAKLIHNEVKDYDKLVPNNQELGPFLGQLTQEMQRAGMADTSVRALAPIPRGKCDQLPIELRGAGSYQEFQSFLARLEGLDRKSSVNHLVVDGTSTLNGQVNVELSLAIYNTRSR